MVMNQSAWGFFEVLFWITSYTLIIRSISSWISRELRLGKKWKRLKKNVMTFCEWLKARIKTDKFIYHKSNRFKRIKNNKSKYCRRYIAPTTCKRHTRVASKTARTCPKVVLTTFCGMKHKHSNKCCGHCNFAFDSDSFEIGIDNHASACISNCAEDFISHITPCKAKLKGITGNTIKVVGIGTVRWHWNDDQGRPHEQIIKGVYYIPDAPIRILAPQHWSQQANDHKPNRDGTHCGTYHDRCELLWNQGKFKRTVKWSNRTNTAIFRSAPGYKKYRSFSSQIDEMENYNDLEKVSFDATNVVSDDEDDAYGQGPTDEEVRIMEPQPKFTVDEDIQSYFEQTPHKQGQAKTHVHVHRIEDDEDRLSAVSPEAELLRWHYRLGHMSFKRIRLLALVGILPKYLANIKPPKCAGCIYGAMTKRPWTTRSPKNRGKLPTVTSPGDCVSVDQLESTAPGFIAQMKGRLTKQRYQAATIFVDHQSRLGYVHLQRDLTSVETLKAKKAFEAYARHKGVQVKHYHADNGRFADNMFIKDVANSKQTISYCGVNAHFQNGIAEKRIRDLQEQARKMLLHAKARWPEAINASLWPYAVRTANDTMNHIPDRDDGSSRVERFGDTDVNPNLKVFHSFGCPVYALNNNLQANKSIPKWDSRARVGVNLGLSPRHARSVTLVLSTQTGLVSPQFHVTHDDFFETVRPNAGNTTTDSKWQRLSGLTSHLIGNRMQREKTSIPRSRNKNDITVSEGGTNDSVPGDTLEAHERATYQDGRSEDLPPPALFVEDEEDLHDPEDVSPSVRRSGRLRRPTQKVVEHRETIQQMAEEGISFSSYYESMHEDDYKIQDEMDDPIAFIGKTDKDTMYFNQAMKQPDREQFVNAVIKEINDHTERKHWELIPKEDVPEGNDILPSVWAMKRKRHIVTRQPYKWKARLNVHGGKQEYAVNFFETFAPVVTWTTIRLLLVLALLCGWHTRQVDFVLAYPQAEIEFDLYMDLPKGIQMANGKHGTHVLKLLKNLYGQKQAGRTFYLHLVDGLVNKMNFKQSDIDECVFYRGTTIFTTYVDDGIVLDRDERKVDEFLVELALHFDIEDKGQIDDYLGVHFDHLPDNKIKLSQPHLIDQILDDVGISTRSTTKDPATPALSTRILQRNECEANFDGRFDYRSVVGKLNFLEKSTRPDIAYATHQIARFSSDPKKSHGAAVYHLARYLKATKGAGITMDPRRNASLECFCDADFCGQWSKTLAPKDAGTAKSRAGYVIFFAGCPIVWSSKLLTQVALSTTEAEYMAMSMALRSTVHIMQMLKELRKYEYHIYSTTPRVYCKCFEDNSGALEMARVPKLRPRTKHINTQYHWFRSFIRSGQIIVMAVKSSLQVADIFTKPLPVRQFVRHRKPLMNWDDQNPQDATS